MDNFLCHETEDTFSCDNADKLNDCEDEEMRKRCTDGPFRDFNFHSDSQRENHDITRDNPNDKHNQSFEKHEDPSLSPVDKRHSANDTPGELLARNTNHTPAERRQCENRQTQSDKTSDFCEQAAAQSITNNTTEDKAKHSQTESILCDAGSDYKACRDIDGGQCGDLNRNHECNHCAGDVLACSTNATHADQRRCEARHTQSGDTPGVCEQTAAQSSDASDNKTEEEETEPFQNKSLLSDPGVDQKSNRNHVLF
ncbi:hypothetical protein JOQ06_028190 [Pogonophryne albipinna]|uniref:Uncharacterized protein n=1 Tax=Pogonophryne albipinna TaxID=1090488 RepID=A0AAD6AG30_9TELE|nr:hypothetical protein JOQ06_028190 [Pogonophryne albipinna]